MGVHAAGTQHGLVYHFAPLEGTRAPVLIALESRAAAAHVPFQPLQQLIWQIMGGLSYSEMPAQSQQLVDQLIPEFRGRLSEDFVETLQKGIHNKPDWLCKYAPWACKASGELDTLNQRYERTRQTLLQNADNFEALSRQMVNVIPGMAENAGPSSWSRVNSRVYARLSGGNVYGEMSTLEIRVMTSAASGNTASRRSGHLDAARYALTGSDIPSEAGSDLADVPLEALIAYPNQNMQGVTGVVGSGPTVQLDTPTINGTSVSVNGVATPTAPGSTITQIAWNWGDGTPAQIGWFPETHSYAAAGNYTISVTATDSNDLTGSAQTAVRVSVSGASSPAIIWVAQAQASSDRKTAGQITLKWNAPGASNCTLMVSPSLPTLLSAIAVSCNQAQTGWSTELPIQPTQPAQEYTFMLTSSAASGTTTASVSVYALPTVVYGPFGQTFSSVSYTQFWPLSSCDHVVNALGCWGEFGLNENSPVLSTALSDGIAVSGMVGLDYVAGGVVDQINADYNPLAGNPAASSYAEHLNVNAQEILVSVGECSIKLGPITLQEGGAGLASYIVATDSTGESYPGDPAPDYCVNLLTPSLALDEIETQIEDQVKTALTFAQFIGNAPAEATKVAQDYQTVSSAVLSHASVPQQVQDTLSVLNDVLSLASSAGVGGAFGISTSNTSQHWTPSISPAGPYTFSPGVSAVGVEIGFGAIAEVAGVVSSVVISGVAVPADPPATQSMAESFSPPESRPSTQVVDRAVNSLPAARPFATAKRLSQGTARVLWRPTASAGILGYRVIWAAQGSEEPRSVVLKPDITSYTIQNLTPERSYIVGIVAKQKLGLRLLGCLELGARSGAEGFPCPGSWGAGASMSIRRAKNGETGLRKERGDSGYSVNLAISPPAAEPAAHATLSGVIHDAQGEPVSGTSLELTATEGSIQAPSVTVTTGRDGSFRVAFTAPPTPGLVIIRARVLNSARSVEATTILRVVPKK